jgi:hypothetical protein
VEVERRTYGRGYSLYTWWELWPAGVLIASCKRGSESRAKLGLVRWQGVEVK